MWHRESTLLAFYAPEDGVHFALSQAWDDLFIVSDVRTRRRHIRSPSLHLEDAFKGGKSAFIAITSGPQRTAVWINGSLAQSAAPFPLALTGSLVVANSPVTNESWSGDLRGLAIYESELTEEQILSHYQTWTTLGRPRLSENDCPVALYLFDEGHGSTVHDRSASGIDLYIPQHYMILNQKMLEPFWKEFTWDPGYWRAVLINVAGFVPLGFFFCAYFASVRRMKRAALATITLGLTVSLIIETLQAFLPTRDSGTTDIITNTLGTCLGTALYLRTPARILLAYVLDRLPFVTRG